MRKESRVDIWISVIEKALFIEIGSKEKGENLKTHEFSFGYVEIKVPKGHASRDTQQLTGSLEERSVLQTDIRFISLNIYQPCLRKKSPNKQW